MIIVKRTYVILVLSAILYILFIHSMMLKKSNDIEQLKKENKLLNEEINRLEEENQYFSSIIAEIQFNNNSE